jgi:hypothetical protein
MKKALLIFLLTIGAFIAKAQDEEYKSTLPPDLEMLTTFYKGYMAVYNDGSQPSRLFHKQSQMRKAFCTPRAQERYWELMQKMEDESDAFIKAPGVDREAMRNLQVVKVPNQNGRYKISYQMGDNEKVNIELAVIKDKAGEWKIDYLY